MGEMVPRGLLSHRTAGGKVVPKVPKGEAFPSGEARFACFPFRAKGAVVWFYHKRRPSIF